MAENCFENLAHENLDNCPNIERAGGTSTRLLYIPEPFVDQLTLPAPSGDFETRITIPAANLVLKADKGFKGIDVMVDENELRSLLVGNRGNKKNKAELDIYIPGLSKKSLGFVDAYKNVPLVCAVTDANGNIWILGTKRNPAFMDTADGTSGKVYEDNNGIAVKLTANAKLYYYAGDIAELPDTTPDPGTP